ARELAPEYEQARRFNPTGTHEEWAKTAIAAGRQAGVEHVGEYVYRRDPTDKPIESFLPNREAREEAFNDTLKETKARLGIKGDVNIIRIDDLEGKARWAVVSPNGGPEGNNAIFIMEEDEIAKRHWDIA